MKDEEFENIGLLCILHNMLLKCDDAKPDPIMMEEKMSDSVKSV